MIRAKRIALSIVTIMIFISIWVVLALIGKYIIVTDFSLWRFILFTIICTFGLSKGLKWVNEVTKWIIKLKP